MFEKLLSILKIKKDKNSAILEQKASIFPILSNWVIDPYNSSINFKILHMGMVEAPGRFNKWESEITGTSPNFLDMKVKVKIQVDSIQTDMLARDIHLKSSHFFDIDKYPSIVFESTLIKWKKYRNFVLEGYLTIKGVKKLISLQGKLTNFIPKDMFGFPRVGFSAHTTINRKEWNLDYYDIKIEGTDDYIIDSNVKIEILIEMVTKEGLDALENMIKQQQSGNVSS